VSTEDVPDLVQSCCVGNAGTDWRDLYFDHAAVYITQDARAIYAFAPHNMDGVSMWREQLFDMVTILSQPRIALAECVAGCAQKCAQIRFCGFARLAKFQLIL
jgi:hypothetical protein